MYNDYTQGAVSFAIQIPVARIFRSVIILARTERERARENSHVSSSRPYR